MVYKWYYTANWGIICHRSHLLGKPETTIEMRITTKNCYTFLCVFAFFGKEKLNQLQNMATRKKILTFYNARCFVGAVPLIPRVFVVQKSGITVRTGTGT